MPVNTNGIFGVQVVQALSGMGDAVKKYTKVPIAGGLCVCEPVIYYDIVVHVTGDETVLLIKVILGFLTYEGHVP